VFTLQPLSQTVNPGATVQFSVTAKGFMPISFQWRKDGVNIPGEILATLTLSYDVVATNLAGSTTSDPATLAVEGEPAYAVYLGNAGTTAPAAYSPAQIKALQQTAPQLSPVFRSEFTGEYEISSPQSGQNEYRVMATPAWFVDGTVEFRSGGAVLPMSVVQTDLMIDGNVYRVYRTTSRSAGDFTVAGNTAIEVVVH
jgi:hypothetical protein